MLKQKNIPRYFFFSGREKEYVERKIVLSESKDVATYDLKPEMSSFDIRDAIFRIRKESADFVCLNFANADMVGHTGVFEGQLKACEVVDECIEAAATTATNMVMLFSFWQTLEF